MKRLLPVGLGLILGFVALLECSPRPAIAAEPAFSCPPPVKLHVVRRHLVHHYVARTWYREVLTPVGCGTIEHPCNVEHLTVPFQ